MTSITTDFGVEVHTLELPNILQAFLSWHAGTPLEHVRGLVDHSSRLFYAALRIAGWCHCWGNLMKYIAEKSKRWPEVLDGMRALVNFWQNRSWRKYMKKVMQGKAFDLKELDHFTASMAKWRYETIPATMKDLLRLRIPSQYLSPELFPNAKDKTVIQKACDAGRNPWLWSYMDNSYNLCFLSCEECRRWGMVCECPEHVRMRQEEHVKHIECFHNSRRLAGAWIMLQKEIELTKENCAALTSEVTGGSEELRFLIEGMLTRKMAGINARFGYLKTLPWLFARADTQEGCAEVMKQVRLRPLEEHDALTRRVMSMIGGDIQRCAEPPPHTLTHSLK